MTRSFINAVRVLACMGLAIVAGCSIDAVSIDDELKVAPGDAVGYLVGTIGIVERGKNKTIAVKNELRIRNVESGASFKLVYSGEDVVMSPTDIREDDKKAAAFRVPLPPGEYEIFKAYFFYNSPYESQTWENEENFSLPITIEADREVYIGELIASTLQGKNAFGIGVVAGYRFDISDRRDRDFAVLEAKFPDFSPERTTVNIPAKSITIDPPHFVIVPVETAAPAAKDVTS